MPAKHPMTLRAAAASLMTAACSDLAQHDGAPEIGPMPDRKERHRYGQETFVALLREAWRLPERVQMSVWLDTFPEMSAVRQLIEADEVVRTRVDTPVGTEFALQERRLDWLLVEHLLDAIALWLRDSQVAPMSRGGVFMLLGLWG